MSRKVRFSVYHVYAIGWALATAAAALSAFVLTKTFGQVQDATAATQHDIALEQIGTLNITVAGSLHRMQIETASRLADVQLFTADFTVADFMPGTILDKIGPHFLAAWTPYVQAADEVYGYGFNILYPLNASVTNYTFDNCIQVYADIRADFSRMLMISLTNDTDKLEHAFAIEFDEANHPRLGAEQYTYEWFHSVLTVALVADDFFFPSMPFAASDGHSFWYFTHQRYFNFHGVEGTAMTFATGFAWLQVMLQMRAPGSDFVLFDSNNMTLMTTDADDLVRLKQCQGNFVNGVIPTSCISAQSSQYPIPNIRNVFNRFYHPAWNDLAAPLTPFQYEAFTLQDAPYVAAHGVLFGRNQLKIIAVWYQPRMAADGGATWVTPLICCMTVVSTVVLSVLGIAGILLPLMRLGRGMRFVTDALKRGETGMALEARERCVLVEVDRIGMDFETIVVDFLGFSSSKARDLAFAPKDGGKPFAVIFTDIESSSMLWGKDTVEMGRCIQAHHDIIRDLLRRHRLFEVKTVGDSFMVTTVSPDDAVNFAIGLQVEFYEYNWQWPDIEDVYRQKGAAFVPGSGRADSVGYQDLWNGPRVRIGIHFGYGDVVYDEVVKGYDYYGAVVNTASRIEAAGHGGQVLVSEAVLAALANPLGPLVVTKKHGVHPLRGIERPPPLVELQPRALAGRTFPPLRTGAMAAKDTLVDVVVEDVGSEGQGPRSHSHAASVAWSATPSLHTQAEAVAQHHSLVRSGAVTAEAVAQHLLRTKETLLDAMRPLGHLQQSTTLKTLCKAWGVRVPPGAEDLTPELLLVAQRMAETPRALARLAARTRPMELTPRDTTPRSPW